MKKQKKKEKGTFEMLFLTMPQSYYGFFEVFFLFFYLFFLLLFFFFLSSLILCFLVILFHVFSFKIVALLIAATFIKKDAKDDIKNLYMFIAMIIAIFVVTRLSVLCIFLSWQNQPTYFLNNTVTCCFNYAFLFAKEIPSLFTLGKELLQ